MPRDFSESVTGYVNGYRVVKDWRCGVRRIRVFDPFYERLMTKEDVRRVLGTMFIVKYDHKR
jgi:hypothetical protein